MRLATYGCVCIYGWLKSFILNEKLSIIAHLYCITQETQQHTKKHNNDIGIRNVSLLHFFMNCVWSISKTNGMFVFWPSKYHYSCFYITQYLRVLLLKWLNTELGLFSPLQVSMCIVVTGQHKIETLFPEMLFPPNSLFSISILCPVLLTMWEVIQHLQQTTSLSTFCSIVCLNCSIYSF